MITTGYKTATAVKVKRFYSIINQAVRLASEEYGDPSGWTKPAHQNYNENLKYFNTYFAPFLKTSACKKVDIARNPGSLACAMLDGGGIIINYADCTDIIYVTDYAFITNADFEKDTRRVFSFQLGKIASDGEVYGKDTSKPNEDFVVPYILNWDGTVEGLTKKGMYSCSKDGYTKRPAFCTKLLQVNGWKFPADYPW